MISVASMAATRGWTAFNIQAAVARQLKNEERTAKRKSKGVKGKPAAAEPEEEKQVKQAPPEKTFNTYPVDHTGHFNALAMVGDRHLLPGKANTAAIAECMTCPLYKGAGPKTCGTCPLVGFLNRLVVEIKKVS
jgi:hypothetical protein